ncbi:hypothetical protein Tco_1180980 [Tanacetum coccineum]
MAYTSSRSSSSSNSEVDSCSKSCVKAYATLKEQYDSLSSNYKKSQFNLVNYKEGLQSVEDRLVYYKKNEAVFEESIKVLKFENAKSKSDKGYHAVLPPYTGNYMPYKPDLTFIDEHFESESVDVVSNVASSDKDDKPKSKVVKKTVEFKTIKQDEVPDGNLKKKIVVPTAAKI